MRPQLHACHSWNPPCRSVGGLRIKFRGAFPGMDTEMAWLRQMTFVEVPKREVCVP